ISMPALKGATGHPLAREPRFQLILLCLQILGYTGTRNLDLQWHMRSIILSGALHWFENNPQWSYGGNRIQIKAEISIMSAIVTILQRTTPQNASPIRKAELISKQSLLVMLLESEISRLTTWLYPLDSKRIAPRPPTDVFIAGLLETAWKENPAIAVNLLKRFPSPVLEREVRNLILSY